MRPSDRIIQDINLALENYKLLSDQDKITYKVALRVSNRINKEVLRRIKQEEDKTSEKNKSK